MSVCWSVASVCHNFLKGLEFTLDAPIEALADDIFQIIQI